MTALVLGVNVLLKTVRPGSELSGVELGTVWAMMLVASGIPSSGLMRYLIPLLVSPFYFASPENEWAELFHHLLPDWLVVSNPKAVLYFYERLPEGEPMLWGAWIKPMVAWSGFVLVFFWVSICWCVLLRRQWVEHERFSFPLVQLPVEMFTPADGKARFNRFFKAKPMWIGFAIPIILHGMRGLHLYFPSIPSPPVFFPIAQYFSEKPFSALRWWPSLQFFVYPSVIAVVYLLTLEISFSFWFFFLLARLETVLIYATGNKINHWVFHNNQQMGGYLVFIGFIVWLGKNHLGKAFGALLGRSSIDDSDEALPYAWASAGFICGTLLLALMCALAGMQFWVALLVWLLFLVIATVLMWMVANAGLLFVQQSFLPGDFLTTTLGQERITSSSWTILAYQRVLMFDLREFLMPSVMNNLKMADAMRMKPRPLLLAMLGAVVLAVALSYYSSLTLIYRKGALNLQYWTYITSAMSPFTQLANTLQHPKDFQLDQLGFLVSGGLVMLGILVMRHHYLWWKIHPIGFLMTTAYATYCFWGSFFLGWLAKYLTLKFGGIAQYRKLRPVFLGVLLGECVIGGIWIVVGMITGIGYRLLPG